MRSKRVECRVPSGRTRRERTSHDRMWRAKGFLVGSDERGSEGCEERERRERGEDGRVTEEVGERDGREVVRAGS